MLAALGVATGSYWLAARWATRDLQTRLVGIRRTLAESTFPLNQVVLRLLADLTQSELVTFDAQGAVLQQTLEGSPEVFAQTDTQQPDLGNALDNPEPPMNRLVLPDRRLLAYRFSTRNPKQRSDQVDTVLILFDETVFQEARRRAAILPLVTGLSTIVALTSITLLATERMVRRIAALQERVQRVAAGDFQSKVSDNTADELGRLGAAVETMAGQLQQLWTTVHRQEGEKLLHQIAGGLAHQLRNSLTGARMAIELHAGDCSGSDDEGLRIAITQIEQAEDYVRRLLLVASGRQDKDRPIDAAICLHDVQASLSPVARHLNVAVRWDFATLIDSHRVADGAALSAAISNLVLNAIQVADQVDVRAWLHDPQTLVVSVSDNGPGIPDAIVDHLFEPFVTSKPEGLGLGLPVVQRAAEQLGGRVAWNRNDSRTVFDFYAQIVS